MLGKNMKPSRGTVAKSGVWAWFIRRAVPLVALAVAVGAAAGWFRWVVGFIPGFQGMFIGGVLAWMAGRWAKRADAAHWGPGRRFRLWLMMSLSCGLTTIAIVSLLHAPLSTAPLDWLYDVTQGFAAEEFLGAGVYNTIEGKLNGGWWIALNVLDLVFLFSLGILILGVVVEKRLKASP